MHGVEYLLLNHQLEIYDSSRQIIGKVFWMLDGKEANVCKQQYFLPESQSIGDEDCLYINVYTSQPPSSNATLLHVMVWIYGGGFAVGDGNYATYGPDQLVSENVIVVTFNYRLGIFGFAFTADNVAPGNLGLKDQIFALQWVQRNIEAFGGDKNLVTVFGESAGAVSVSYLVVSPLGKVFKR
ncbi:Carboxylesterase family [Popillia japonica]|uniref:Carboxylic ester hydrolase n=1 Tax=Popillia japonica TaxID=7064 RepID=A0AAW1L9J5_POPJA